MENVIFRNKTQPPTIEELQKTLGATYCLWESIRIYTHSQCHVITDEWIYEGEQTCWSFRMNDRKRNIAYMLPRSNFFIVELVFGQKAAQMVVFSRVAHKIKKDLRIAQAGTEGKSVSIIVKNELTANEIKTLIALKLFH